MKNLFSFTFLKYFCSNFPNKKKVITPQPSPSPSVHFHRRVNFMHEPKAGKESDRPLKILKINQF